MLRHVSVKIYRPQGVHCANIEISNKLLNNIYKVIKLCKYYLYVICVVHLVGIINEYVFPNACCCPKISVEIFRQIRGHTRRQSSDDKKGTKLNKTSFGT
jgi:hypothetical protein